MELITFLVLSRKRKSYNLLTTFPPCKLPLWIWMKWRCEFCLKDSRVQDYHPNCHSHLVSCLSGYKRSESVGVLEGGDGHSIWNDLRSFLFRERRDWDHWDLDLQIFLVMMMIMDVMLIMILMISLNKELHSCQCFLAKKADKVLT